MLRKAILATVALILATTAFAASAVGSSKTCTADGTAGNGWSIGGVVATNLRCHAAQEALQRGRLLNDGNFRTHGFKCRIVRSGIHEYWDRCVAGRRSFRFEVTTDY